MAGRDKVVRRLTKELSDFRSDPPFGCTASPKGDNLMEWTATIQGPVDTPYEGGEFRLTVKFPDDYPFHPPRVTFDTRVYHCNISDSGSVCLDILKTAWSPAYSCAKVLMSIIALLQDPNPQDPLMGHIAREYASDRKTFLKRAREHTLRYAMPANAKLGAMSPVAATPATTAVSTATATATAAAATVTVTAAAGGSTASSATAPKQRPLPKNNLGPIEL
eukprot:ANDGO_06322.mRNA.1 Ubiquitin-conjugating enzyme E2-17 kDa